MPNGRRLKLWLLIVPALALAACGDDGTPTDGGDDIIPPAQDTTGPQYTGSYIDPDAPDRIRVEFDENISAVSRVGFQVTVNGQNALLGISVTVVNSTLFLQMIGDVAYPDFLTVAYDSAAGNVADRAEPANPASSFGPFTVNNEMPNRIETVAGGNGLGGAGDGGPATDAQLNEPLAVVVRGSDVYVADSRNRAIRRFQVGGNITTILDSPLIGEPQDMWFTAPRLYVASSEHCIVAYDFSAAAVVGGTASVPGFYGDDSLATAAEMNDPQGVWLSGDTVYVADTGNHRVRRFTLDGDITTVAGDGSTGPDAGDEGAATAATIQLPYAVRGHGGALYVCNERGSVRRFTDGGTITTIVGEGLSEPRGLFVYDGYLYIADTGNHAVRRVPIGGGTLETIAGGNGGGYTGDGGPASAAKLALPFGIFIDDGYLYIADTGNYAVRRMYVPRSTPIK